MLDLQPFKKISGKRGLSMFVRVCVCVCLWGGGLGDVHRQRNKEEI